ncbi:phytoene/squalene synthase family protein [Aquamicrobium zhengzhouense]|uniref:Phytoene/squalene synthase family protein n=1 Tax=Aquamicrobium zhengzhouense TaxID=2781738 RepID=A0ABS0SIK7_9HYPH|nr:phytoene/squalene synthase family protein [Aquamicrobium zhengzhouense]MBI1622382.1 phytoene/squalene synthase family protein [Aquamicrobium zhengzhouense]
MKDPIVEQSRVSIEKGSQSFAAASRLFDRETRNDSMMLYAWCRHCDDVIDGQVGGHGQAADFREGQSQRLDELRLKTSAALAGEPSDEYIFEALRRVISRHQIPHRHPQELLTGFEMDVEARRYRTIEETLDYCYHVAGVVGVMMAMIMGVRDKAVLDRACDLGIAFQLTNIARDVIDDARSGRVYVPEEVLSRHGVFGIAPEDRDQWPRLHAAALDLLDFADDYYQSAYAGLSALPARSAWAIAAARRVYQAIGQKLRANGPSAWEQRVSTTKGEKISLLTAGLRDVAATRGSKMRHPRNHLWQRPL